ncbi:MAG: dehydrogenase, partial [Chitinophagaceae bacterium]|nr:dehydrogenase [Chitinophagaceae bacterium]
QLVTKKSGFFDSEWATWKQVAETLGIPALQEDGSVYARHPFVFLVEAADDICYRVIDFEDAHRLGIISHEKLQELFLGFFDEETGYNSKEKIETTLKRIIDPNQKVQYLRARLINHLVYRVRDIFLDNQRSLLDGTLQKPLIGYLPEAELQLMQAIDHFSVNKIYNHRSVVEIEVAGYNVIGALLEHFALAVMQPSSGKSAKLLKLIPAQFQVDISNPNLYHNLQGVVDYIAGMTDLYAMDLYKKIKGINI